MHDPITVQLSRVEVLAAVNEAVASHLDAIGQRYQDTRSGSLTAWDTPINEALVKAVVAKWLNGRTDVMARSALRDYGNLVISDADPSGGIICLVSCLPPVFKIHGFIRVHEAQARTDCMRQTLNGRRWWISRDELNDPRELGNA